MDTGPYYLTPELLHEIVSKYQWPAEYVIEDDQPDGVILQFPNCGLIFSEDSDGGVDVAFFTDQTQTAYNLHLFHAMLVFAPETERVNGRILNSHQAEITSPFPSLENTTNGIHSICRMLLDFLSPVLQGDFTWVEEYRTMYPDANC